MKSNVLALLFATAAFGQDPIKIELENRVVVLGSEAMPSAQTIAGAPFSADETTSTTQTLPDGNRIVNTSTTKVYRDSQGRTRIEQTLPQIGAEPASARTVITISDPVAGVRYSLDPETHSAYKMAVTSANPAMVDKLIAELKTRTEAGKVETMAFAVGGPGAATISTRHIERAGATEDIGTSNMAGVPVKGSRTTMTIPAGSVGNDRDINIVNERWYSPDLKMNIMTKRTDPRFGDTAFQVTNLVRTNPDASLFQVPADYQVKDNPKPSFTYKTIKDE